MFKVLANLFSGDPSKSLNKKELSNSVKEEFKNDYIDNRGFVDSFPLGMAHYFEEYILDVYRSATSSGDEGEGAVSDPVFHIFGGLRSLYISLWLVETGYGEKLALKMGQLLYTDGYGDICFDDWNRELHRFVERRLYMIGEYLLTSIPKKYQEYAEQLEMGYQLNVNIVEPGYSVSDVVEELASDIALDVNQYYDKQCENHIDGELDNIDNPYDYERAISKEFISLGWESYVTSGSGDQGADVIAEKNGIKLIVQCKLYSSPVGNKAVQEVAAAGGYYKGDITAVITNNEFTKSARQLAESLGVYLLHHSQIGDLDEVLFEGYLEETSFLDDEYE